MCCGVAGGEGDQGSQEDREPPELPPKATFKTTPKVMTPIIMRGQNLFKEKNMISVLLLWKCKRRNEIYVRKIC